MTANVTMWCCKLRQIRVKQAANYGRTKPLHYCKTYVEDCGMVVG